MARYYFHLTDGKQVLTTHEGVDLPGNAAAREEALRFAGELKLGKTMPDRNWDDWFVTIVNEHGHKVDTIPVAIAAGKPSST
jgi:hypothetical protein